MNRYIPVFALFALVIGLGYFGFDRFDRQYKLVLLEEEQKARAELETKSNSLQAQQAGMVGDIATSKTVDQFLKEWSLHVNEANSGQAQIVSTLTRLASQNGLITSRQPSLVNPNYPLGGELIPVLNVGFSVTGNFPQVIKWLADVEESYLFSRIEKLQISPASSESNEVELSCIIAFPQEKRS